MVDAVVSILIQKLLEGALNEVPQVLEFHEQFKKMKEELPHMEALLKDIAREKMKGQNAIVKLNARKIRDLLYDAEDIMEDSELFLKQQQRRAHKCNCYFSLSLLKYRYQMGRRLSQINQEIVVHRKRMKTYLPTTSRPRYEEYVGSSSQPATYPVLINDDEIVGLDDDLKKIKRWVMEEHGLFRVIGIVGMGGIGKTTLAEKIKNNINVRRRFEHILFVTVSKTFYFEELIKIMLRNLGMDMDSSNIDVPSLLEKLRQQLEQKRYLVILDDVWGIDEKQWWVSLKSFLPQSNNGCRVIVTTRNVAVARSMGANENHIHHGKILSDRESWSLFVKIAFASNGGECPSSEIELIGKDIVAKCRGLPLAIKVVGGMMLGKGHSVHDWRRISEHLKEELVVLGKDEKIFDPVQLSYEELPTHLKPCMLCFAAFPEDYEIDRVDMVYWWIGEGFARVRLGRTAFETGKDYFDELLSRSLLLGVRKDIYERRFETCRVHDMVRDMIIKIAKEENFLGFEDGGMLSCIDKSRRVGFFENKMDQFKENNSHVLRTIIGRSIEEEEFVFNIRHIMNHLKWLRVLSISFKGVGEDRDPSMVNWWSGLGSLRHLICLQIRGSSYLDRLPESIENIQNLQVLFIRECPNLKRLPVQVTCLEKLTVLDLDDFIEYLPKGIGKLTNLESLKIFRPANSINLEDGCRLSDLKMLIRLREFYLLIKSEDQLEEGELKVLSELKQLEILTVSLISGHRKVDHELPPLEKLQELSIFFYQGRMTPAWLNPTTLPHLRILRIEFGNIASMRRDFFGNDYKVWELEILHLIGLSQLEEDWKRIQMAMPSLRQLKVHCCPKLKSHPAFNGKTYGVWRKDEEND